MSFYVAYVAWYMGGSTTCTKNGDFGSFTKKILGIAMEVKQIVKNVKIKTVEMGEEIV
jgi:hypothetical protein